MEERGARLLLAGATGMVGGLALRDCLGRPEVSRVTVIGRRATGIEDPRLREVRHDDFTDFGGAEAALANQDCALFCLGAYTGAVDDETFRTITVDYTVAFAEALRKESPDAVFCLLSGQGADPSERSRMAFARYKGAAENALLDMSFPRLHLFRPGYIYPVEPREEPNATYRLIRLLYPLVRRIYPNIGVASDDLARAMVDAALEGTGEHTDPVLENRDIRKLAESRAGSRAPAPADRGSVDSP